MCGLFAGCSAYAAFAAPARGDVSIADVVWVILRAAGLREICGSEVSRGIWAIFAASSAKEIRAVINWLKMVGPHATPVYTGVATRAVQISRVTQVIKL